MKSVAGFTRGENLALAGVIVSGLVMLAVAQLNDSPFFKITRTRFGDDR